MLNMKFFDGKSAGREPLVTLADLDVEAVDISTSDVSDAVSRDADADEYHAKWATFKSLCESRGLRAVGSYELTWALYCLGVLDSAVGWFHMGGYFAPYAWPARQVALMLSSPLVSSEEDPAEVIAETALHEEARDAAFQEEGWLVVRINPRSRRLNDQLKGFVGLVGPKSPDPAS